MNRTQWVDLPEQPRKVVEKRFGKVIDATSAGSGFTPGIAARLDTEAGTIFLKAIPVDDWSADTFSIEREVSRVLPPSVPAPRMLWHEGIQGWLMMAFEYLSGEPADLSPGSPDLPSILKTIGRATRELTPCPWPDAPTMAQEVQRWQEKTVRVLEDPRAELATCIKVAEAFDLSSIVGDTLLHADLHGPNILVGDQVYLIDWGLACRGAEWIEAALFASRLVGRGHSPEYAESLVSDLPGWGSAPGDVAGFIAARTLFSEYLATYGPERLRQRRRRVVDACNAWACHLAKR